MSEAKLVGGGSTSHVRRREPKLIGGGSTIRGGRGGRRAPPTPPTPDTIAVSNSGGFDGIYTRGADRNGKPAWARGDGPTIAYDDWSGWKISGGGRAFLSSGGDAMPKDQGWVPSQFCNGPGPTLVRPNDFTRPATIDVVGAGQREMNGTYHIVDDMVIADDGTISKSKWVKPGRYPCTISYKGGSLGWTIKSAGGRGFYSVPEQKLPPTSGWEGSQYCPGGAGTTLVLGPSAGPDVAGRRLFQQAMDRGPRPVKLVRPQRTGLGGNYQQPARGRPLLGGDCEEVHAELQLDGEGEWVPTPSAQARLLR